ncbi:MAG: MoxR family ATPase [Deltaproteobacteria bacterium]|jgi:MoxR-like ATPase|nr:MoxR family ATPase [Deltaproteobacteria bacterium]
MDLKPIGDLAKDILGEVNKAIVGQAQNLELMLTSLLCGGHVLLEGAPGSGKTLMAQAFAWSLSLEFGRIQFTPDLMPGDVIGTNLFNFQTNSFALTKGPIFAQILLADEINRAPPKTQAALLQAMSERSVTIDRQNYDLGEEFMVVATQNPIEQQGTYPLPEAQLDRFLFKLAVDYPTEAEELEIVQRHGHGQARREQSAYGIRAVVDRERLAQAREAATQIKLSDELAQYAVALIRASRGHPWIETGASTRAAASLAIASRAYAAIKGRDFVAPDDVKALLAPLARHRLVLSPAADIEGITADQAVAELINQAPAPR